MKIGLDLFVTSVALLFEMVQISPAIGQTVNKTSTHPIASNTSDDEIVVRAIPKESYRVNDSSIPGVMINPSLSIQAAADARHFSRCVKPYDNSSVHELIDSPPYRVGRAAALERIIRGNKACYPGYYDNISMINWYPLGACNARGNVCQSFYDRGALVEKTLALYAANLSFTVADLADRAVIVRFRQREDKFNRTRPPEDRLYSKVAGCMVARQPTLALALEHSNAGSAQENEIRAALIGGVPECLGGATRLLVDPPQFRFYIADAIYSWAVALKNIDTLIPTGKRSP